MHTSRTSTAILPALMRAVATAAGAITDLQRDGFVMKGSRACKRPALPAGCGTCGSGDPIQ